MIEIAEETRTYSLEEFTKIVCGEVTAASLQWTAKRLCHKAEPHFDGYKSQRKWRVRHPQVLAALAALEPAPVGVPVVPSAGSMTAGSRRRLAS